jgi:hypothetical protein
VRSSILKNPNPLTFNITLPAKVPPKAPPGIRNPKTFLEVGRYLHTLLIAEMHHGCDPFLAEWKEKPKAFGKAYQTQFIAYAQGAYPFTTPLTVGQSPLQWWMAFEGTDHGGILAVGSMSVKFASANYSSTPSQAIAIKLFGALPHSMGDERTMSAITMINSAQRNRQKVDVVMALTQVRAFYYVQTKPRVRTFSLTLAPLNSFIPPIHSFGGVPTLTQPSNSSTSSGGFVPLTMTRVERRQEQMRAMTSRRMRRTWI